MKPPFELVVSSDFRIMYKTVFLFAVTSARRLSKLYTLKHDPPFLPFHTNKVTGFS